MNAQHSEPRWWILTLVLVALLVVMFSERAAGQTTDTTFDATFNGCINGEVCYVREIGRPIRLDGIDAPPMQGECVFRGLDARKVASVRMATADSIVVLGYGLDDLRRLWADVLLWHEGERLNLAEHLLDEHLVVPVEYDPCPEENDD